MPSPTTTRDFLATVCKSGLVDLARLDEYARRHAPLSDQPARAAEALVRDGLLTKFQARQLLAGRYRGFVLGRYKILEPLGAGGMGTVFLAEHMAMRRRVAIKVLPKEKAADPATLERFYREGRAVAALDHPNIVRAHDIQQERDAHFLVMEYVEGRDLGQILTRQGPIPFARAASYARQAALGLQHAFERGLVHRDIKPANLLVDRQGVVKVLDLGLARSFNDPGDALTQKLDTGAVVGTADYMSPEQAVGCAVDVRSDVYSLGATLYALIAGRAPFAGPTPQKMLALQFKEPLPLHQVRPEVPPELAAVVARMMAKQPAARYQSPAEVAEALAPWAAAVTPEIGSSPTLARGAPAQPTEVLEPATSAAFWVFENDSTETIRPAPPPRKQGWLGPVLGVAAAVLVTAGVWGAFTLVRSRLEEGPTTRSEVATAPTPTATRPRPINPEKYRHPLRVFAEHTAAVQDVAMTPEGNQVLSAGKDGTLRLWAPSGRAPTRKIETGFPDLLSVAISADGRRALSGASDQKMRLWDLDLAKEVRSFPHGGGVWGVAFHPDGRRALSACADGLVRLWDLDKGTEIRKFEGHRAQVWSVAVSPNGKTAASGSGIPAGGGANVGNLRFWDVETGRQLHQCGGHTRDVRRVAFRPDGARLASSGFDGTVRLWDVAEGKERLAIKAAPHYVESVAFVGADGKRLLTCDDEEHGLRLWNADTGLEQFAWYDAHAAKVTALAVSANGQRAVTCSDDRTVRLWDLPPE